MKKWLRNAWWGWRIFRAEGYLRKAWLTMPIDAPDKLAMVEAAAHYFKSSAARCEREWQEATALRRGDGDRKPSEAAPPSKPTSSSSSVIPPTIGQER